MFKKSIFVFLSVICIFISVICAYAQDSDSYTIVTYYPSPYGVYREMRAQRMAIGEDYINAATVCWSGDTNCPVGGIPTGPFDPDVDLVIKGNVGIGTTTPDPGGVKLTVVGGAFMPLSVSGTPTIDSDNRVIVSIIDTTSYATGVGSGISLGGFYNSAGAWAAFGGIKAIKENGTDGNWAGTLIFNSRPSGGNPTERMRITSTGNVGIGTTGPSERLDIVGGQLRILDAPWDQPTLFGRIPDWIRNGGTDAGSQGMLAVRSSDYFFVGLRNMGVNNRNDAVIQWGDDESITSPAAVQDSLRFVHSSNSDPAIEYERMRIDPSGNVGIGTTGPGQRLEVMAPTGSPATSGSTQNGILRIQGSSGGNGLDIGVLAGSPYGTWMQAGYKGDLSINYPLLLNPNGGNVGIGTTAPGYKLTISAYSEGQSAPRTAIQLLGPNSPTDPNSGQDLRWSFSGAGTALFRGARGGSWDTYLYALTQSSGGGSGDPTAGAYIGNGATAWSVPSDIRLKENIQNITNALQKIESIRGVSFDWKNNHKHQLGLIAQEVDKSIPEVVDKAPDGYLGIRYTELIPVLVEGIKEQQKEIKDLKEELAQQKVEIASLKGKL